MTNSQIQNNSGIRREANEFEKQFKTLLQEEAELYEKTIDGGDENDDGQGYLELLFAFKQKSTELYEGQVAYLKNRLLSIQDPLNQPSSQVVETPMAMRELSLKIDQISKKLLLAEQFKSDLLNTETMDPTLLTDQTRECDLEINSLTFSLFQALIEFRDTSRRARIRVVAELQSQLAYMSPKSPPLIQVNVPQNVEYSGSPLHQVKEESTLSRQTTLKRVFSKVRSSLILDNRSSNSSSFHQEKEKSIFRKVLGSKRQSMQHLPPTTIPESQGYQSKIHQLTVENDALLQETKRLTELLSQKEQQMPSNDFSIYNITGSTPPAPTLIVSAATSMEFASSIDQEWDDSKSAWEQDSWRIDNLARFQTDLQFINNSIKSGGVVSKHHERLRARLISRIEALTLPPSTTFPKTPATMSSNSFKKPRGLSIDTSITSMDSQSSQKSIDKEDEMVERGDVKSYMVIDAYRPKKADEIALKIGDRVQVMMTFTNGIAHGTNLTSTETGFFPLSSINAPKTLFVDASSTSLIPPTSPMVESPLLKTTPPISAGMNPTRKIETAEGMFMFSMVPPAEALKIIASMPAERRVQYLKQMGSSSPTTTAAIVNDNKVQNFTPHRRQSNTMENWTKVQKGWRDALEAEITLDLETEATAISKTPSSGTLKSVKERRESFWRKIAENYKIERVDDADSTATTESPSTSPRAIVH